MERSSEDGTGRIVAILDVELEVKEPTNRSGKCREMGEALVGRD